MRKTALLTGVAGLFLMTAPAFAQDGTAPQTPPAPAEAAPPAAEPQSLTLQPGSDVKGSDGTVLGQLEGARNTEAGQELTVRGADGQLRGVPVAAGVRQEGEGVAVGWTSAQFASAPSIADDSAAPVAEPAAPPMPEEPAVTEEPTMTEEPAMAPATPATPATPPAAEPATPATPATPPVSAEPANPVPGEGEQATPDEPDA